MRALLKLLLIGSIVWLGSCTKEPLYQSQSYVFGTLVDVSIYGEDETRARKLTDHVLQEFQGIHNRLHAWQSGSSLSQLNQAFSQGSSIAISDELASIIKDATTLSSQSDGLFNPAIGNLIHEWGFQRDEFIPVKIDPEQIATLVKTNPQMSDIVVENNVAHSTNPAVKLDLGGYAKGYALDLAARYLRGQGVNNALINIGGNIIALGKHGETPWRVGIQHPRKPGPIATLDLPDGWAVGTSGDYQRYFELDGKRYCHVIDPRSGYPAQGSQAVTILVPPGANAGTLSDVASKPIFIAEQNERANAAAKMSMGNVMVIDAAGKIFLSAGMKKRLQWIETNVQTQAL
ncbi:MAG: FAD:protein FMN transferase [Methylophilaceae bacterium]